MELTVNPATGLAQWLFVGNAIFSTGLTSTVSLWHLYYFGWDTPAGGTSSAQIDVGSYTTLAGHAYTPTLSTDQLVALPPGGGGIAHFAEFNHVLTAGQVSSIYNGQVGAQAWPGSGGTLTALDLIGAMDLLNKIYAAVHKDY
jgi:hypothetical protein